MSLVRSLFCLWVFLALTSCDLFRDESIPPGVDKEQVSHLPEQPEFNVYIRPLLWKLSHQENAQYAAQWQKYSQGGLAFSEFETFSLGPASSYGVNSVEDYTLLWRWTQQGGSVDHKPWLLSELPRYKRSWLERGELSSAQKAEIASRWLGDVAKLPDNDSAFSQWVHKVWDENFNYKAFIKQLYKLPEVGENSLGNIKTHFLTGSASQNAFRLARILGAEDGKVLGEPIVYPNLFEDFEGSEKLGLYDTDTLERIESILREIEGCSKMLVTRSDEMTSFPNFDLEGVSYIPSRKPDMHLDFAGHKRRGVWGKGMSSTVNRQVMDLPVDAPITTLSFWSNGRNTVHLSFQDNVEIQISQRMYSVKVAFLYRGQPYRSYEYPLLNKRDWNHIILAQDFTSPNGVALYLNGKDISPVRSFPVNLSLKPSRIELSGDGVIDEFKVFSGYSLSKLECHALYDPRVLKNSDKATAKVLTHLNHYQNSNVTELYEKIQSLWGEYSKLAYSPVVAEVLFSNQSYVLESGAYFTNIVEFTSDGFIAPLSQWMFNDASVWTARATVKWLYEVMTGKALYSSDFPEDRLPEDWEVIDQWAATLIAKDWDLEPVVLQILAYENDGN